MKTENLIENVNEAEVNEVYEEPTIEIIEIEIEGILCSSGEGFGDGGGGFWD